MNNTTPDQRPKSFTDIQIKPAYQSAFQFSGYRLYFFFRQAVSAVFFGHVSTTGRTA